MNSMKSTLLTFTLFVCAISMITAAPVGTAFTYQGRLTDGGAPASGIYDLRFTIYDAAGGGNSVGGPITNSPVGVTNGLFTTRLDFGAGVFTGDARWLEIGVRTNGDGDFTTLSPRQPLTASPFALYASNATTAATANTVMAGSVSNAAIAVGAVDSSRIADGTIITDDIASIDAGKIVGGDLQATRLNVGIGHILNGAWATIAGGTNNSATNTYATVGGGQQNTAGRNCATVAGGQLNTAGGSFSFVGGGDHNNAGAGVATIAGGSGNSASGLWCAVGGGYSNTASNDTATVAGGYRNLAGGNYSFVGGGWSNLAYGVATVIGGGSNNFIHPSASYSSIVGGQANTISPYGVGSVIAGGGGRIPFWTGGLPFDGNHIEANYVAIGGGSANDIYSGGDWAVICGGSNNLAYSKCATVAGGERNVAGGPYSFAAGYRAQAIHAGAFVWSDSLGGDLSSSAEYQFTVRCSGGARFFSTPGLPTMGVQLSPGGNAWSPTSDRNVKENFAAVNSREMLKRLDDVPVTTWNLKSQPPAIRHIGPMAQDFYAAFNVREDDRHISTSDADGVAFAAIKGLYELLKEKDAEIQALKRQNQSLEQSMTEVKALVNRHLAKQGGGAR